MYSYHSFLFIPLFYLFIGPCYGGEFSASSLEKFCQNSVLQKVPLSKTNVVIESKKITDIFNYVDQDTLVIFDLDNTLIEGVYDFSSPVWYDYRVAVFQSRGLSYSQALKNIGLVLKQMKDVNIFKAVEPETYGVIKTLHDENIKTIGLTSRFFVSEKTITEEHLSLAKIELFNNTIYDKELPLDGETGFSQGILYSGPQTKKGELLISFLKKINFVPKKILFIDDSMKHIQDMHDTLTQENIPFICIRYGFTDERISRIDGVAADRKLLEFIGAQRYEKLFGNTNNH